MNSFRIRIFLCCVPAIFANGCNPTDPCGGACDPDQVCVDGTCETVCENAADCDAGLVCDEAANTCVECVGNFNCNDQNACTEDNCAGQACSNTVITCDTVEDCPAGCNAECLVGICFDSFECVNDEGCDAGEFCDGATYTCVECVSDADCDGGEVCDEAANTCGECVVDDDCNDNNACTEDHCNGQTCFNFPFLCFNGCPAVCDGACSQGYCTN